MTTMHTESFMAFERLTSDDNFTTANTAIRQAVAENLRAAGYDVVIGTYATAATANGWMIRPDPVDPTRAALVFSPSPSTGATTANAAVRKPLVAQARAVIGGFSLYIPQEFVPSTATGALLRVNASPANVADTAWNVEGTAAGQLGALQIFSVCQDLKIRMMALNQSARSLTPGRMHFLEFRVADNDVRVWLDDVLVLQHSSLLMPEAISLQMFTALAAASAQMSTPAGAGKWAISNFYVLSEDERAPNVRLGPTTRIIGVRPTSDVDVDFQRAAGFTSNAQVAAQNLVAQPAQSLQAINVGDEDVYAAAASAAISNAKLVHAVTTKVMASNLEAVPHRARALIRSASGVERVDPKTRELKAVPGVIAGGTRDFWQPALRPTDNAIFMVGTAESVYKTPPNGVPGSPWSMVSDTGSAVIYRSIAFRADGTGVIGRSDGKIQVIAPGTDIPGPIVNPSTVANTSAISGILVTPDGAFTMTCVAGIHVFRCEGDPSVPANWVRVTAPGVTSGTPFLRPVYAAISNKLVITTSTGLVRVSSDMGKTYVDPGAGTKTVTADRDQVGTDGQRFLLMSQFTTTASVIGYSPDGLSWTLPNTTANNVGGGTSGQVARIVFGDAGIFIAIFDTYWMMTADPTQGFRRTQPQSPFNSANYPIGACVASNGDWIFASTKGVQLAYTTQEFDTDLPPLAGYKIASNSSTVNPDTGAAWLPADAGQAQFGVRITS